MKKIYFIFLFILFYRTSIAEGGTVYTIRVDGMACSYCAYGVEKSFKQIKGVKEITIDLDNGLVIVSVEDRIELTRKQMELLFKNAGFTFRRMTQSPSISSPSSAARQGERSEGA